MPRAVTSVRNYTDVSKAICYLVENHKAQPTLAELADAIGISKFHLQRLFSDWAGISPKKFIQYLTKEYAKQQLRSSSVLESALSSGLSGSSRLHDLMVTCESVTPGEYKSLGKGVKIVYGIHPSRFGDCFVAQANQGVCKLAFIYSQETYHSELAALKAEWQNAQVKQDQFATGKLVAMIFAKQRKKDSKLNLFLKGSPFQIQVWEALLRIPESSLVSYQSIAESINNPSAVRSVATAVGQNNIGYLVPCHRVIRSTGVIGKYRWGETRKAAIIAWEAASTV